MCNEFTKGFDFFWELPSEFKKKLPKEFSNKFQKKKPWEIPKEIAERILKGLNISDGFCKPIANL